MALWAPHILGSPQRANAKPNSRGARSRVHGYSPSSVTRWLPLRARSGRLARPVSALREEHSRPIRHGQLDPGQHLRGELLRRDWTRSVLAGTMPPEPRLIRSSLLTRSPSCSRSTPGRSATGLIVASWPSASIRSRQSSGEERSGSFSSGACPASRAESVPDTPDETPPPACCAVSAGPSTAATCRHRWGICVDGARPGQARL